MHDESSTHRSSNQQGHRTDDCRFGLPSLPFNLAESAQFNEAISSMHVRKQCGDNLEEEDAKFSQIVEDHNLEHTHIPEIIETFLTDEEPVLHTVQIWVSRIGSEPAECGVLQMKVATDDTFGNLRERIAKQEGANTFSVRLYRKREGTAVVHAPLGHEEDEDDDQHDEEVHYSEVIQCHKCKARVSEVSWSHTVAQWPRDTPYYDLIVRAVDRLAEQTFNDDRQVRHWGDTSQFAQIIQCFTEFIARVGTMSEDDLAPTTKGNGPGRSFVEKILDSCFEQATPESLLEFLEEVIVDLREA